MPRKKTIQPLPVEWFTLPDGIIVEIRDETCKIIGRGLHKQDAYEKKLYEVLAQVVGDYLTMKGRKKILPANDYLSRPVDFFHKVTQWGLAASDADESTIRNRLYKDIKKHIKVLERCINANKRLYEEIKRDLNNANNQPTYSAVPCLADRACRPHMGSIFALLR
jgi:hypothetical protein